MSPSKYAENQFDTATRGRLPLMGEILADVQPKLALTDADAFTPVKAALDAVIISWSSAETFLANSEAGQLSATLAFEDRMSSLTRKPDADTNSLLETWDVTIRGQVAYQGTIYTLLLPHGRETLTGGTLIEQLDALRDFGIRLGQQATKTVLVALGLTVTAFYNAALALRNTQDSRKAEVKLAYDSLEVVRVQAAAELFAMAGIAMSVWKLTPLLVDSLYDVGMLRGPELVIPTAPVDTLWVPLERRLSTTALPTGATRLEAWRLGPGGAPERLAVGDTDTTFVLIPAEITFDHGKTYQLWLTARNSRGTSPAGPVQTWVAP